LADKTGIEWTDASWNPTTGCTKISAGCKNCYAKHQAWPRLKASPGTIYFGREFEQVGWHTERLQQPLSWTRPRRIFVNSMSDLFHEDVPEGFINGVFAVMAESPWHTFQVLTKRPARMREYLSAADRREQIDANAQQMHESGQIRLREEGWLGAWPLPNVWLGVSVEDQETADERIPILLNTSAAAVRWISAEPLLAPIDLSRNGWLEWAIGLDWVVVGGESGPGARPMHPAWARSLRDQCVGAGVPFLFKQHGDCREVVPGKFPTRRAGFVALSGEHIRDVAPPRLDSKEDGEKLTKVLDDKSYGWAWMEHVGKKAAGRELDGRTWDEYPS
jgi:protein gp37